MCTASGKALLCSLVVALVVTSVSSNNTITPRIVNGHITHAIKVPYLVRIGLSDGSPWCSGTLVTLQHVVTAAHCLDSLDPIKDLLVIAGVSTLGEEGQVRTIINYEKPEHFSIQTFDLDYAVLKVNEPFTPGRKTSTVNLCSKAPKPGNRIQVSGFGKQVGGGRPSYYLRTVFMPVITKKKCSETFSLTDSMFCASLPRSGPCQGDSGGPVIIKGELCGIVSWGLKTCDYSQGAPAVFTNISAVLPHIEDAIENL